MHEKRKTKLVWAAALLCIACATQTSQAWPAFLGGTPKTPSLLRPGCLVTLVQLQTEETEIQANLDTRQAVLNTDTKKYAAQDAIARADLAAQVDQWNRTVAFVGGLLNVPAGTPFTTSALLGSLLQIGGTVAAAFHVKNALTKKATAPASTPEESPPAQPPA